MRSVSNKVTSKISNLTYHIDTKLNCDDCGIYRITCPCSAAYTGKTTTSFGRRCVEHFQQYRESSVLDHTKVCSQGKDRDKFRIQFLENCFNRGKYTLSEREYLWNERLGGEINVQKILGNS